MKVKHGSEIIEFDLAEIFYYLFWLTMIYAKGTGLYEGMPAYKTCLVLAMLFWSIKLILTRYTAADLCWMTPLLFFGGWIYLHSGDQSALILIAVMVGLKDVKLSRVFFSGAVMWSGCFIFSLLRTFLGGYTGPILAHEKLGLGPILRWSLGYPHPNVLHVTYVIISAFILYLWNQKKGRGQWTITLLLLLGNIYIFVYSVSFTGFLLMMVLLIFNLYLSGREKLNRVENILLQSIFPFCILFSVVGPIVIDGDSRLFQFLTNALNSRYSATKIYIRELGITWWGAEVPSLHGFAVDCSYTWALLSYGCVFFLLIVIGYLFTINQLMKNRQWTELAIVLALLVAGISEPFLFNTSFKNITVLFVGSCLLSWSKKIAEKGERNIWSRDILMCSCFNKKIEMSFSRINMFGRFLEMSLYKKRNKICIFMFGVGSICTLAVFLWGQKPDSIFIGTGSTDCGTREEKYIDINRLPDDFNSEIYEYPGPDGAMYEFSGNMVTIEYIRNILSGGVFGSMASGMMCMVWVAFQFREKRYIADEKINLGCGGDNRDE